MLRISKRNERIIMAKPYKTGGARDWWAQFTPEQRSQISLRRQAVARKKKAARLAGESPADRRRRLDRERKRIERQASTRSPFEDSNPETPMSGPGVTLKSRLLEIENALTALKATVLALKTELGF
jgi:hypothetical protein